MKKLLITGGSGFIGRNLTESLRGRYQIFAPTHAELDLLDLPALERFVRANRIDAVVHGAIHVPMFHGAEKEFFNDMRMFANMEKISRDVEKVLYFGSGAEFDKRYDITMVREERFGETIPVTEYGLAKYTMNLLARGSDNIYNLRLFGIFGKYELWDVKFISNLCCKAAFGLPLTVRRQCAFDFFYIEDLADVAAWFLEHTPRWHDYNVCMGVPYLLTDLAETVRAASGKPLDIVLLNEGRDPDYTADNRRLLSEMPDLHITPMPEAIEALYRYYDGIKDSIDFERLRNSR